MGMTKVMADVSGKVEPAVLDQHAAAARLEVAVQLIAERGRTVAAAVKDLKSAIAEVSK
jgi:hypothetical protein